MGMAKLSNGSRFIAVFVRFIRSDSPARDEDEMWRGEVRMQMEGKKERKKKEKEQFVFRAMAAFRAVHIIYVLTSFNFTDYRITRKI